MVNVLNLENVKILKNAWSELMYVHRGQLKVYYLLKYYLYKENCVSVQHDEFSPREYSHVTNIQIKKWNIPRPPEAPLRPFAITALSLKGNH